MAVYDYAGNVVSAGGGGGDVTERDYYSSFSMFPRIAVVGDSYANGYCGEDPEEDQGYNHPLVGWPVMLARRSGSTVINYSWGGRSTRNFISGGSLDKLVSDQPCDLYILALQRNDWNTYNGGESSYLGALTDITENTLGTYPDTFYGNYATIIETIQNFSEKSRIVLVVGDYSPNSSAYPTSLIVEDIASHYNLPKIRQRDDAYFNGDNAYYWSKPSGGHPAILAYAGLELAMERLFQKCIKTYRDYFLYYTGLPNAANLPNDRYGKVDVFQGTSNTGKILAVGDDGSIAPKPVNDVLANISQALESLWDKIYPVGSIYMSVSEVSPAILFGGAWERLKDKFLLGAGDIYELGATGGTASQSYTPGGTVGNTTLTINQIPSHSHGLNNHTHSVGAHSHGLNAHTHSVGAHTHGLNAHTHTVGAHSHGLNNHTHTIPAHTHNFRWKVKLGSSPDWNGERICGASERTGQNTDTVSEYSASPLLTTESGGGGVTGAASGSTANSAVFNTGNASGTTEYNTPYTSGPASGSTANSSAFNTGAASGNTTSSGGGGAHSHSFTGTAATLSNMPPYQVVNMWQRTA